MCDDTIVNHSPVAVVQKLGNARSAIGLVSDDPEASARRAAEYLRSKRFNAEVVEDVEPNLPVYFVVTDAMLGAAINFRPPVSPMAAAD